MVSVIVVDYKGMQKTCDYIHHVSEKIGEGITVHYIVVDNNENDESLSYVFNTYRLSRKEHVNDFDVYFFDTEFGEMCFVRVAQNTGYAKGNNIGTIVSDYYYDDSYYLISNNDLIISETINLKSIFDIFDKNDTIAVIGPRVVGSDGTKQSPYTKKTVFYLMVLYQWTRFWPIYSKGDLMIMNKSDYCYRVMGCFMFVRADYFRKIDRFDENTFLYAEEAILSERLDKIGKRMFYYDDLSVVHEHGKTISSIAKTLQIDKWCFESMFYYCKKYRGMSSILEICVLLNRKINVGIILLKENIKRAFQK